ncbi:MAG: HAMP domain-containing protein [bacterium]|nr:HAMP domain-containing protein [bacterium]
MRRFRLHWLLYPTYVLLTVLSLASVGWYVSHSIREFYLGEIERGLETRARLLEPELLRAAPDLNPDAVDALCKSWGEAASASETAFFQITVYNARGEAIGDSRRSSAGTDAKPSTAPVEVAQALEGRVFSDIRHASLLNIPVLYVATPIRNGGDTLGVIRTAASLEAMEKSAAGVWGEIAIWGVFFTLVAFVIALYASKRLTLPLKQIERWAERMRHSELGARVGDSECEEIGTLAESINAMAETWEGRLRSIMRQNNEQQAILASMIEGVVALDQKERVILLNKGAVKMLDVTILPAEGRKLHEVVRISGLQRLAERALADDESFEDELSLPSAEPRYLRINGAPLKTAEGERIGAVLVLNDVTRLRRLENIRRDFVANVSHELKTPITSIKGFVETLLDGAMNEPDDAARFLAIIAKQSDRLHAIIEDLLTLSRIEQSTEKETITLERARLNGVIRSAIESCEPRASEKGMSLEFQCADAVTANVNPPLLEQALVNLIDNAVKYSEPQSRVLIELAENHSEYHIRVRDWGSGISEEHLPRLFERFYRVDKARSRTLGGTGLGLAIVKHIAQAHGGRVTVKSKPGEGSTFTFHLLK